MWLGGGRGRGQSKLCKNLKGRQAGEQHVQRPRGTEEGNVAEVAEAGRRGDGQTLESERWQWPAGEDLVGSGFYTG